MTSGLLRRKSRWQRWPTVAQDGWPSSFAWSLASPFGGAISAFMASSSAMASSNVGITVGRTVEADDRVELHQATPLKLSHLCVRDPDELAHLALAQAGLRGRGRAR
jgi:hypothetical protein